MRLFLFAFVARNTEAAEHVKDGLQLRDDGESGRHHLVGGAVGLGGAVAHGGGREVVAGGRRFARVGQAGAVNLLRHKLL